MLIVLQLPCVEGAVPSSCYQHLAHLLIWGCHGTELHNADRVCWLAEVHWNVQIINELLHVLLLWLSEAARRLTTKLILLLHLWLTELLLLWLLLAKSATSK